MSTLSRLGAPSSLNMASTATGSVADTNAPQRSASGTATPAPSHIAAPTTATHTNSPTIASTAMGITSRRSRRTSRLSADSKSSAGSNTKNTKSGDNSKWEMTSNPWA